MYHSQDLNHGGHYIHESWLVGGFARRQDEDRYLQSRREREKIVLTIPEGKRGGEYARIIELKPWQHG